MARTLLLRAREARLSQDSALRAYDAKSYLRMSVGMGVRSFGTEKLLMRTEQVARVRWSRGSGVWVEPTGARAAFPMGRADADMSGATPIPYFPGRESLWIPSSEMGVARAEVDENDLIHPLAIGAEAYYRYATGDSLTFRLPDGKTIAVRELRITARRPAWRTFVGSFWFDVARGSLVRATYRLAEDIDLWNLAQEDEQHRLDSLRERARTDTGAAAKAAAKELHDNTPGLKEKIAFKLIQGTFRPMRASLSAVTVEYGLYDGRFWLPKLNVAEAQMQAGFMRIPIRWEERFQFNSVNGGDSLPPVPASAPGGTAADTLLVTGGNITLGSGGDDRLIRMDMSPAARAAREDSLVRRYNARADSLRARIAAARARGDSSQVRELTRMAEYYAAQARLVLRRREACAHDSTYVSGTTTRFDGAVRVAVRMPCNPERLANSPDLPGSIYEPGETLFDSADRDALLGALGLSLQPGWGPLKPQFFTGLSYMRYNRIESFSIGGAMTETLGAGYKADAVARYGFGDRTPNGELSLSRSNGRTDVRVGVFKRLSVANDDWGDPLSVSSSIGNLISARDEGFYYRSWGAELAGVHEVPGRLGSAAVRWRLFAEQQHSAGTQPNTQASLGDLWGNPRFGPNIDATALTAIGGGADVGRAFGLDPTAFHLTTRVRLEGAFTHRADSLGNTSYGRSLVEATLSRSLGWLATSLTGATGVGVGDLPIQRAFYVGGLQTVRGQSARLDGTARVGDTFWLGRAELGLGRSAAFRPAVFYDVGWAGDRRDYTTPGRPLSGAGAGLSMLEGLFRVDVARGIWPERDWKVYAYLGARF